MSLLLTFITSLLLGMRHATDSDHIVAVTAIASRERSVFKAAAAVLIIVPLIPDPRWAVVYLLVFGLGTVVGMTLITLSIAAPSFFLAARMSGMQRSLRIGSGAVSLVFGLYLAHKVGVGDGLFTSQPRWTPQ